MYNTATNLVGWVFRNKNEQKVKAEMLRTGCVVIKRTLKEI